MTRPSASYVRLLDHVPGREYAYDEGAEASLAVADKRGWTVVSMHNDFKVVFDR